MTQMYQPNQPDPGKGMAIASLVLGIVSIVFCWITYLAFIPLVLGIVAVVLAVQAGKKSGRKSGMAIAGLVLGIIGIVFSALVFGCSVVACSCGGCYACQVANAISYY